MPDPLLVRLKRETHASHAALESRIDLMDRLRSAADYRKLLEAFYGLFSPMILWPSKWAVCTAGRIHVGRAGDFPNNPAPGLYSRAWLRILPCPWRRDWRNVATRPQRNREVCVCPAVGTVCGDSIRSADVPDFRRLDEATIVNAFICILVQLLPDCAESTVELLNVTLIISAIGSSYFLNLRP